MSLRERIIENSMEMFLNRGCKSVTMDDIATENGISKRTLYELFSDKSALLDECILHTGEKVKCNADNVMKGPGNVLDMIFKVHEQQAGPVISLRINFFSELKKYYPDIYHKVVVKLTEFHMKSMEKFLQRGQEEGLILKDIDKTIISKIIIEISNIIDDKEIFSLENVSRKQLFKETLLYYFRGISTDEGIKIIDNYLNK
ncbi:MAG: TetR/AcrR family transcriptional regulator [Bacteroidales bacterium]